MIDHGYAERMQGGCKWPGRSKGGDIIGWIDKMIGWIYAIGKGGKEDNRCGWTIGKING